jgi:hypothetical protein
MDDTENSQKPALPTPVSRGMLTRREFRELADVPPELEWFANMALQEHAPENLR